MPRFLIQTDLHDEFWQELTWPDRKILIQEDVDAILLAGDLSTKGRTVDVMLDAWRKTGLPVRAVYGNHDFYHASLTERREIDRLRLEKLRAEGADIDILERKAEIIAGVRILGCTLWTDLELYPSQGGLIREVVGRDMKDFTHIRNFRIVDWLVEHVQDRDFLFTALENDVPEPTLVMTHHLPLLELIHPTRSMGPLREVALNGGYASDLARHIRPHRIAAWLCGHSHDNQRHVLKGALGPILFVTNARGYPRERCAFDPGKILTISEKGATCSRIAF